MAAIEAALDTDGGGPAALLLLGEAGIGKSSLIRGTRQQRPVSAARVQSATRFTGSWPASARLDRLRSDLPDQRQTARSGATSGPRGAGH